MLYDITENLKSNSSLDETDNINYTFQFNRIRFHRIYMQNESNPHQVKNSALADSSYEVLLSSHDSQQLN